MGKCLTKIIFPFFIVIIIIISSSIPASALVLNQVSLTQRPGPSELSTYANMINSNPKPLTPGFTILINSSIYPSISTSISQYSSNINDSGYCAKLVIGSWPTIELVRAILKGEWENNGSAGVVMIGDFPVPWFNLTVGGGTGWEYFPCDLYYMDLDGAWGDSNGDGNFETHTGNVAADIIFGRLTVNMLKGNEAQLLNNYFYKNNLYRTGQLKLPNKNLVYVDDDWFGSAETWKSDAEICYENVTLEKNGVTTCEMDYKSRLVQDYEFVQVHCHANHNATRHNFKVGGNFETEDVNFTDIMNIDPHTFFTILFTCGAANYTVPNYLAGGYIFADTYGLASISSSRAGGMLNYDDFYKPLSENKSIGEAFKDWFVLNAESSKSWFYGMTLFGDPLLVPNQYDLKFVNITFSNPKPYSDETVYVHAKVKSQFDNCSEVEVKLYDGNPSLGGTLIETQTVDLGWNQTVELNFTWLATVGTHDLWVVIDENDNTLELNESNNIGHRSLHVYEKRVVELSSDTNVVYTFEDLNLSGFVHGGIGIVEEYYFDFGDGNNSGWLTENYTLYNYSNNGVYYASLKVIDSKSEYTFSNDLEIHVINRPPVAIIDTDLPQSEMLHVNTSEVVTFNAFNSYDLDGMISSYYWDFGDTGSDFGLEVNHSYSDDGSYIVKLQLLDDDYGFDEDNITILVNNRDPVAVAEVDNDVVMTNEILTFNAGNSYDDDGGIVSYHWDFGDGNTSNFKSPQHKYLDNANYTVSLKVTDDDGDVGFAALKIEVRNRGPTADISCSSYMFNTNTMVCFNATVNDPDGYIAQTTWDFGDGSNATGASVTHEFIKNGSYKIFFTATDDDGAQISESLVVYVKNVAPEVKFNVTPVKGNTSTTFTFNSLSYDTDGSIINYTWELGDGNFSYGKESFSHQYTIPGNYTVTLRITDDDGAVTEFKILIEVEKVPVIEPPQDEEPELDEEDNRTKDEDEGLHTVMIIGISAVIIVIIIILAVVFLVYRKKRSGNEGQLSGSEVDISDENTFSSDPEPSQPEETEPVIEWDDDY